MVMMLLINPSVMLEPTDNMSPSWIMMRPMQGTAFVTPFILARERNTIARAQIVYFCRQIDIVRN
jgi:hypothetical protein